MRPRAHYLRLICILLLLGLICNLGVSWGMAALLDLGTSPIGSVTAIDPTGEMNWTVNRWERPGAIYVVSERELGLAWSASQATGAPDTPVAGDRRTAWASASSNGGEDWLELEYAAPVHPAQVRVYESYNPGAMKKVTCFDENGAEIMAWQGKDPTPIGGMAGSGMGTSSVDLTVPAGMITRRIRVYVDSRIVPGWNEIDAVGLVDSTGQTQWAIHATASSSYAQTSAATFYSPGPMQAAVAMALPFTQFASADDAILHGQSKTESRAAVACGWPMLAVWSPQTNTGENRAGQTTVYTGSIPPPATGSTYVGQQISPGYIPISRLPINPPTRVSGLPWRPIWTGFIGNSLLYAVAVGLLWQLLVVPRRFFTEVSRVRRGCCIRCGYDLGYDFRPGCPECGWRRNS